MATLWPQSGFAAAIASMQARIKREPSMRENLRREQGTRPPFCPLIQQSRRFRGLTAASIPTALHFTMALHYKGFRIYAIPRNGGYFARLRKPELPFCRREAPFIETEVFHCEADALQEARRLADSGEPQPQS